MTKAGSADAGCDYGWMRRQKKTFNIQRSTFNGSDGGWTSTFKQEPRTDNPQRPLRAATVFFGFRHLVLFRHWVFVIRHAGYFVIRHFPVGIQPPSPALPAFVIRISSFGLLSSLGISSFVIYRGYFVIRHSPPGYFVIRHSPNTSLSRRPLQ